MPNMFKCHVCYITLCSVKHMYCQTSPNRQHGNLIIQLRKEGTTSMNMFHKWRWYLPNLRRSTSGRHRSEKGGTHQTVLPGQPQEKRGEVRKGSGKGVTSKEGVNGYNTLTCTFVQTHGHAKLECVSSLSYLQPGERGAPHPSGSLTGRP